MKYTIGILSATFLVALSAGNSNATVLDELIASYQQESGISFDSKTGEKLWNEDHLQKKQETRSCRSCHGKNLKVSGKHLKTKKKIKAMAPSVNVQRLTDKKFIEKWFKRNCRWAWGRLCSAAEKGQILTFLKHQ